MVTFVCTTSTKASSTLSTRLSGSAKTGYERTISAYPRFARHDYKRATTATPQSPGIDTQMTKSFFTSRRRDLVHREQEMGSFEFGVHRAFVSFSGSLLYSPKGQKVKRRRSGANMQVVGMRGRGRKKAWTHQGNNRTRCHDISQTRAVICHAGEIFLVRSENTGRGCGRSGLVRNGGVVLRSS